MKKYMDKKKLNNIICCFMMLMIPFAWVTTSLGSIYRIATLISFVLWLLNNGIKIKINKQAIPVFLIWTIYVLYTCLTLIWSVDMGESFSNVFGMVLLYMTSIFFLTSNYDEEMEKMINNCFLIDTIILLLLFIFGTTRQLAWGERVTLVILGTPTDANEFASFFIIGVSVLLKYFFDDNRKYMKLVSVILIVLSIYVLFMTASRGALISVLFSALFIMSKKMTLKKVIRTVLFGTLIFIAFLMLIVPNVPTTSIQRITIQALLEDGGSGRSQIWSSAIKSVLDGDLWRIIFGYGYCRFGVVTDYGSSEMMMHNQFIQQFVSYGIIGLIIYSLFIFQCGRCYKKLPKEYQGIFYGLLLMSMTLTMGPSYKVLWSILFFSMLPMRKTENDKERGI